MTLKNMVFSFFSFLITLNANAGLINFDFESNLDGWDNFNTINGTLGDTGVKLFDTNNNGNMSNAFYLTPGKVDYNASQNGGGGITQNISSLSGWFTFSADIASYENDWYNTSSGGNASGGLVQMFINNILLDSYDFGHIDHQDSEYGKLSSKVLLSSGVHELKFLITRPYERASNTPQVYIDNIAMTSVPEPSTIIILLLGLSLIRVNYFTKVKYLK